MQLHLGSCPVVVGSSVEMAKQFLKIHDQSFAYRPNSSAGKYFHYDYTDILWAPYGPYFRHARKICLTELFNKKTLSSYEYIRVEELQDFLSALYASCGNPVMLKDHILNLTLNNITRVVLGKKLGDDSESKVFKKILDESFLLTGMLNIGDLIPWINFLDLQGYVKKIKALSINLDAFLERELDRHISRRQDHSSPKDMLDVLLQHADDPNPELKLSRNKIKSLTQDLLGAGPETSSAIIQWAMSELLKHPELFAKATEELDRDLNMDEVWGLTVHRKVPLVAIAQPRLPVDVYSM
ncbi:Cytochrome p450 [Thalictrum thalictroides]|uniref:Cytochrome p450 n=1 Tax=Thalictrum thalictroides TaxID=46969 RepID=A0A7J6X503_THATH|nr:Cytochrome p450 [Thalictrum thalictroides]